MANQTYDLTKTPVDKPILLRRIFTGDTADSAANKFDLSDFAGATRFSIKRAKWACSNGFNVGVLFDRSSANPARPMMLSGNGSWNDGEIKDKGTGNTGDIQFTTNGTAGSYMVDMEVAIHYD